MAFKMRSGFEEAEKAVERSKQGFAPPAGRLNYFSLEKGEIIVVRFIDDDIITTKFYEWAMNNQGEMRGEFICAPDLYQHDPDWRGQDWFLKWRSPNPGGIGWQKKFQSQEWHEEAKLSEKTLGIAVEQEKVPDTNPPQFRDMLKDFEDSNGAHHVALNFMLVKQALSNFWDQMVGYFGLYGTICDRPYRIERRGEGNKTTYQAIGLPPDPDWNYDGSSLKKLQAFYGYGVKLSQDKDTKEVSVIVPDDPAYKGQEYTWDNRYLYCGTTLADWAERRASEEYAEYWLNPNAEHLSKIKGTGGVSAQALLNTTRPADPRVPLDTPPTPAPTPAVSPAVTPPAAAAEGLGEFHKDTTSNPPETANAPAEPVSGDRFEQMRQEMSERQKAATK